TLGLGKFTHVVVDGVAVVVVGHQVDGFHVLAVVLGKNGRNRLGCRVGVVAQTEAVAAAVFASGVAGATNDTEVQRFSALAGVLQGDGHRAADAAGDHHGFVLAQEACCRLHGTIGTRFGITNG